MKIETLNGSMDITIGTMTVSIETYAFASGPVMHIYPAKGTKCVARRPGDPDQILLPVEHLILCGQQKPNTP